MPTRKMIPPRERLLEAAGDLFHRHGIRGVGVEAIAAAAGTNKMTLYRHFASKDELVEAWLAGIIAGKEAAWAENTVRHPGDPRAQLRAWSQAVAKKLSEMDARCSVLGNALADLPDPEHPARRLIANHKRREHERVLGLCREAGFSEPELAADQFYILLEGAFSCVQCIGLAGGRAARAHGGAVDRGERTTDRGAAALGDRPPHRSSAYRTSRLSAAR
jgi:AcrR family transcriptional regulator